MKEFYEQNLFGDVMLSAQQEREYFEKRMRAIKNYSVGYFKQNAYASLCNRYLQMLSIYPDDMEYKDIRNVAFSALEELGIDSYIVDSELEAYNTNLSSPEKSKSR
ncbi:MAG: hypothetical protein PHH51_01715 [Bacilli bacterium]|nr:hypothetical protein [Bacilli bacterium]MDD3895732.1 hypothetical protein [Bacilli bacterium]MDD4407787.1 hypothetical protein [Bacilli bacterium]